MKIGKILQPIDRVSIALMLVLSLMIGLLVWGGNACGTDCPFFRGPRVQKFSWKGEKVGVDNTSFLLTFNRPMDRASVEDNLQIEPPLPGKFSWAGRRMAYTLEKPAPYGTTYQLQLQGAREQFLEADEQGQLIQPFEVYFRTRDRAFAYIGVEEEEQGRLILHNLTKQERTILTPPDLVVTNFKPYPDGERILFYAVDEQSWSEGLQDGELYTVTTGMNRRQSSEQSNRQSIAGQLKLVLDNQGYTNLQFDLSQDGQTIVVQRVDKQNPAEFGLWVLKANAEPQPLNNPPGGDFLIAPDSQALAIAQGEGVAILPLEEAEADPLDFLPKYGTILSFSRDGSAAAMVNFNTDNPQMRYTRSLFLVTNQGVQKNLLDTNGSILSCQFDPTATTLYCLVTQLLEGSEYKEQPYLVAIDLDTSEILPLLALPNYQDIQMSLAPDGLGLLLDQVITTAETTPTTDLLRANSGEAIISGRLWLLVPSSSTSEAPQLEQLPFVGFRPRWLP